MSRETVRKLLLGGVLAGLGGWLVLPRVVGTAAPAEAVAATVCEETDAAVVPGAATQPAPDLFAGLTAAAWPADPFLVVPDEKSDPAQPAAQPEAPSRPAVLSAIISGSTPRALIDGKIVTIGDRLADGSTVTAIGPYMVSVDGPTGPYTLALAE